MSKILSTIDLEKTKIQADEEREVIFAYFRPAKVCRSFLTIDLEKTEIHSGNRTKLDWTPIDTGRVDAEFS